jgi:hypothetical protein
LVFNVIEGSIAVPAARLTADAVRGCVVIKCHASLIVRLALVGAAPVLLFDRWVKVFGDCLAAKAADDRSDGCTYNGTHWTCGDCACHGRSSDTSSGCAYPHAHRVRAGRAGGSRFNDGCLVLSPMCVSGCTVGPRCGESNGGPVRAKSAVR